VTLRGCVMDLSINGLQYLFTFYTVVTLTTADAF